MRAKRDQPRKPPLAAAPLPPPKPPKEPVKERSKPSVNKALSIWGTPKNFELARQLRERHDMSFSAIVWALAEALSAGRITLDPGARVGTGAKPGPAA